METFFVCPHCLGTLRVRNDGKTSVVTHVNPRATVIRGLTLTPRHMIEGLVDSLKVKSEI